MEIRDGKDQLGHLVNFPANTRLLLEWSFFSISVC